MDIDKWCEKTRESAPRDVKRVSAQKHLQSIYLSIRSFVVNAVAHTVYPQIRPQVLISKCEFLDWALIEDLC